jgi:hypothetical protein
VWETNYDEPNDDGTFPLNASGTGKGLSELQGLLSLDGFQDALDLSESVLSNGVWTAIVIKPVSGHSIDGVFCSDDFGQRISVVVTSDADDLRIPTSAEVIEEGQFKLGFFPTLSTEAQMIKLINARIGAAKIAVKRTIGPKTWGSTDPDVIQEIHQAILYKALALMWTVIVNIMIGFSDQMDLPPEYVHPDAAAANRDFYAGEAESVVARNMSPADAPSTPKSYVGTFASAGIDPSLPSFIESFSSGPR